MEPGDHLFRHESGRMVAALTRIFGVHNLGLAEDVVQDAFCRALEVWKIRGVPENPSAWLMAAAKNRALDVLRRERTARSFAPELSRFLQSEWTLAPVVEELFTADAIKDDLLRVGAVSRIASRQSSPRTAVAPEARHAPDGPAAVCVVLFAVLARAQTLGGLQRPGCHVDRNKVFHCQ
jgi:predicted RNA polymerase sigma factor